MAKSNNLAEKLILFSVFFVFAVLVVVFAYGWDDITGKTDKDDVMSFAFQTQSKSAESTESTASSAQNMGKININTATESELDQLPSIGATRAKAIIRYRNENGSFKSVDDIKKVKGIGDGIFEDIKPYITVD